MVKATGTLVNRLVTSNDTITLPVAGRFCNRERNEKVSLTQVSCWRKMTSTTGGQLNLTLIMDTDVTETSGTMSVRKFALAVIFIFRLFSASAFRAQYNFSNADKKNFTGVGNLVDIRKYLSWYCPLLFVFMFLCFNLLVNFILRKNKETINIPVSTSE